jgi:hypothetical protein
MALKSEHLRWFTILRNIPRRGQQPKSFERIIIGFCKAIAAEVSAVTPVFVQYIIYLEL